MGVIEVTVLKWRVFNPKSDKARHPHWFRINQDIASSAALFDLSPAQKWAWICVLANCCKKNSETITINTQHVSRLSGVKEKEIVNAIEILEENGTLTVNRQSTVSTLTTHNITVPTEHNITKHNNYSVGQISDETAGTEGIQNFIGVYVKAFQSRYPGGRPTLTGKVQGQIKTFLKDHSLQRACDLIQVYFQMDDKWFETKTHDFTTFLENLQKVSLALDTGQQVKPKTETEKWLAKKQAESAAKELTS